MDIKLPKHLEQKMCASIQRYVSENFGEDIGELKAASFLKFCLEEIAPSVYNKAISDAQGVMQERVTDLENVCFADEFGFWNKGAKKTASRRPDFKR